MASPPLRGLRQAAGSPGHMCRHPRKGYSGCFVGGASMTPEWPCGKIGVSNCPRVTYEAPHAERQKGRKSILLQGYLLSAYLAHTFAPPHTRNYAIFQFFKAALHLSFKDRCILSILSILSFHPRKFFTRKKLNLPPITFPPSAIFSFSPPPLSAFARSTQYPYIARQFTLGRHPPACFFGPQKKVC